MLKNDPNPIPLAKVDATLETDLAARFEVNGFPTIFIFRKGEKELYDGPRSAFGKLLIFCLYIFIDKPSISFNYLFILQLTQ